MSDDLYDDFEKMREEQKRKNLKSFEKHFNKAMGKQGDSRTFREVMGVKPKAPDPAIPVGQTEWDIVQRLATLTTDTEQHVMTRALKVYQSIVDHVAGGGEVQFVKGDTTRTLKVRLKG